MGDLTTPAAVYWNTITWTPEMCAHLIQRRDERWSCYRIGAEMGLSDRAVKSQLTRMGMPTTLPPVGPPTPETHEEARMLHVARPERTDPWALIMRQASLPLTMPVPPARRCQYPYGDEKPYRFCGAATWRGSYCRTCWERCHSQVWAA